MRGDAVDDVGVGGVVEQDLRGSGEWGEGDGDMRALLGGPPAGGTVRALGCLLPVWHLEFFVAE